MKVRQMYSRIIVILCLVTAGVLHAQSNPQAAADFTKNNGVGSPLLFGTIKQDTTTTSLESQHSAGVAIMRFDLTIQNIVPSQTTSADGTVVPTTISSYMSNTNNIQNPSTWNFSQFDTYEGVYRQNGFKIMVIEDYDPPWLAFSGNANGVPANWSIWQDIVKKIHTHILGKIDYEEVWNEPTNFLDVTGSPYAGSTGSHSSDQLAAYKDLYYYTASALRSIDSTAVIGGPVAECGCSPQEGTNILSDPRNAGNINFLDFHGYLSYPGQDLIDAQTWQALASQYGLPNIPIWITEWNYDPVGSLPQDGASPVALSFVGRRLTDMYNGQISGSMIYSNGGQNDPFAFLDNNDALVPKGWTYRLLSKDLRLGSGPSTIASISVPNSISNGGAAVTADGNLATWLVNDTSTASTVDLSLAGLTGTTGKATIYLSSDQSATYDASVPYAITSITVTNGQSDLPNLTLPPYSVLGVLLDGVHGTPQGIRQEAESLPESNSPGVPYVIDYLPQLSNGACGQIYSNAVGQYLTYTVGDIVPGAAYHVIVGYQTSGDRGQMQLSIGGIPQLQMSLLEEYASTQFYTESDLGLYTASGSGSTQPFTFTIVGKNPNSIGYGLVVDYITLIPVQPPQTVAYQTEIPTFSPRGGTYNTPLTLQISSSPDAAIYYTTDGSTPTANSVLYSGPFQVPSSESVRAFAVAPGLEASAVSVSAYTITHVLSTTNQGNVDYSTGFVPGSLLLNGSAKLVGSSLQITTGGTNQAGSAYYSAPVNVQSFTNDFNFQLTNPNADGFTFIIQNMSGSALGSAGGSLGYGGQGGSLSGSISSSVAVKFDLYNNAGEGSDSTGVYTNGAFPTVPSTDLSPTGINLHSGDPFFAHMTYDGSTLTVVLTDLTTNAVATQSYAVDIPAIVGSTTAYVGFTAGTGDLSSTQQITNWVYASNPFFPSGFVSATGLHLNGSASVYTSSARLRLTNGGQNQAGAAFYPTTVNVAHFSSTFNFQLTNAAADGFTFIMQNAGLMALGGSGGSLGYGPTSTQAGIGQSVAIKFDIYDNAGEGFDSTGIYKYGSSPTLPSIDLTHSGITLNNGDVFVAKLTYDGTTLTVTIADTATGASVTQSYTINIPATIGSNYAYVGFTGGSGGYTSIQDVISWIYQ